MNRKQCILILVVFCFIAINELLYSSIKNRVQLKYVSVQNVSVGIVPKRLIDNVTREKIETPFLHSTNDAENTCALPVYNYSHPSVMKGFPGDFPTDNCDKNFKPWTELENGAWMIIKDGGANCSARCFEGVRASSKVVVGEWLEPGYVDCEFLEAVCWENGGEEVYGYIHTQIKPNSTTPPPSLFPNPPNVFVFTIDSMSFGSAKRSLPKFLNYFQSEFQAVEFPFVNKVGENSKPNGIPLWFGKSISGGRKVTWEEIVPDWNRTEFCDRYLDNETHIFKQFKQHGYTTLQMEDWKDTMIDSSPFCDGFYEPPADHIFRPFPSFYGSYGTKITKRHLNGTLCREYHHAIMDYLQQAITAYSDRPLFSWIWLIDIGHDYSNGPYRMDQYLIDYFENNRQVFDDSFVFFVSDHGFRMGVMTEIGLFERNNPYLAISIPKKYRDDKNGMLEMMRVNSRQLQTHFDTRATMLDILMYQPYTNFMDRKLISIPNEKGHSLLRKQPESPRTCGTLPIPKQYCICQVEKYKVLEESLMTRFGQKVIDHVHELLDESNFTSICHHYELNEVPSLIEYGYSTLWNTYEIEVKTAEPSAVHFQTMVTYDPKTETMNFEKVVRLDKYGDTAKCTASVRLEPLCHYSFAACLPYQNNTVLYPYSTDIDYWTYYWGSDTMVGYARLYEAMANVRFDTKQEEEIEYHTDWISLNASIYSHQPDPSLGYGDKATGSNLYTVLKAFYDMTWILGTPYQFFARNFVVSGLGRIEIPTFKTPIPPGYSDWCATAITVQNHTLDNSFVSMNYTFESTDGSYALKRFTNNLFGTSQSALIALNGSLFYKWTIDYHYNTDGPQVIQLRMYSGYYHDFLPLPPSE